MANGEWGRRPVPIRHSPFAIRRYNMTGAWRIGFDPALPEAAEPAEAIAAPEMLPASAEDARRLQARTEAVLELRRLLRDERARAAARQAIAERRADEARAAADAGKASDLYGAIAAGIEARADARAVEFAIALASERLAALAAN